MAEAPGILRWMIEGCLEWQRDGLARPDIILKATEGYFDDQNIFVHFLEECFEIEPGNKDKFMSSQSLAGQWKEWAEVAGEKVGSVKTLAARLRRAGLESGKKDQKRGWFGISLRNGAPQF